MFEAKSAVPVLMSHAGHVLVHLHTHKHEVTIHYYPNPTPNDKKGTKFDLRNPNPTIVNRNHPKNTAG